MSSFMGAVEKLSAAQKDRLATWTALNGFISQTLRIPWEKWIEGYVQNAIDHPLDTSFLEAAEIEPGKELGLGSFEHAAELGMPAVSKVPLRAKNNLGRLSPELQDQIAERLETAVPTPVKLKPSDVVVFQKIFLKEKALVHLKHADVRKLLLVRIAGEDDVVIKIDGGAEVLRLGVHEFAAIMSRALV